MGVFTNISLEEINKLFPGYTFISLIETDNGVMDTTYFLQTHLQEYILKRYERNITNKIKMENQLLHILQKESLHVSSCIDEANGWHIYEKLEGSPPQSTCYFHIQTLARFMAKFHKSASKNIFTVLFLHNYNLNSMLEYTKHNHFFYYKKLQILHNYSHKNDGFIHGDIFKDNTLFKDNKMALIDFIDSGCGEFSFDIAVALLSFNPHNKISLTQLFLKVYNQHTKIKLTYQELQKSRQEAKAFYSLLRLYKFKSTKKAKELLIYS